MFEERKLRKIIESRTTPDMTFEKFCERRGIDAEINNGGCLVKVKPKKNTFVIGMSVAAACLCIITGILLAVFLPRKGNRDIPFDGVNISSINFDKLTENGVPTLLDFSKVEQYTMVVQYTPKGEDWIVGYTVNGILYGFENDGTFYGYDLTMTIRCYKRFYFLGYKDFENLQYSYGDKCKYGISRNNQEAFITATQGDYEYFIRVNEFGDVAQINKENIDLLVQDIFA